MTSLTFDPVTVSRPRFSHRYEVYSPKAARRITLYSWNSIQLWTLIEAMPAIDCYCERPGLISEQKQWRLADFWVRNDGQAELWLLPGTHLSPIGEVRRLQRTDVGRVWNVESSWLSERTTLIRNWQQILPYIVANRREISAHQKTRILAYCNKPQTLLDIERNELPTDPVVTRSTTFELARCGELRAEDLHHRSLGPNSQFITG